MANSRTISLRVPDDLLLKIDCLAEQKYKSHKGNPNRSQVILDAIAAYCITVQDSKSDNDISMSESSMLAEKIQSLEQSFLSLSRDVEQIKQSLVTLQDSVNNSRASEVESNQTENESIEEDSPYIDQDDLPLFTSATDSPERIKIHAKLLAKRLGCSLSRLDTLKSTYIKDPHELSEALKTKDPDGVGWVTRRGKNVYLTCKETSRSLLDKVREWIEKNQD